MKRESHASLGSDINRRFYKFMWKLDRYSITLPTVNNRYSCFMMAQTIQVDRDAKSIFSTGCGIPQSRARDFVSLLDASLRLTRVFHQSELYSRWKGVS